MTNTAKKGSPRIALILTGFLFLANPYIALFDALPDFFGYLLIYLGFSGFSGAAGFSDRLEQSMKKIFWLASLSFARLIAFVLSAGSDTSMIMTLAFTFGAAEIIFAVSFFLDFIEGLEYLENRYGVFSIEKLSGLKTLTVVFFSVKAALNFLPELAAILEVDAMVEISASPVLLGIAGLRPLALMLGFVLTLIIGVWWYAEVFSYFRKMKKSGEYISNLEAAYEKSRQNNRSDNYDPANNLMISFIYICAGLLFYLNITSSHFPVVPDFIGTFLILAGVFKVSRSAAKSVLPIALCTAGAQLAAALYRAVVKGGLFGFAGEDIIASAGANISSSVKTLPVLLTVLFFAVLALYAALSFIFIKKVFSFLKSECKKQVSPVPAGVNAAVALGWFYIAVSVLLDLFPEFYSSLNLARVCLCGAFIIVSAGVFKNAYGDIAAGAEKSTSAK
ncbi:MAG: hypothetical protein WC143_00065 [Eubacteriales bacterium]